MPISRKNREGRRAFGIGEVAAMYGVSADTIVRLTRTGQLRSFMLGGRRLVPLAEIERLEQEGFHKNREDAYRGHENSGH
jgi:excisionase family DNA binding protein